MAAIHPLVVRDDSRITMTPMVINLLIALVIIFAAIAVLVGALLILRQFMRQKKLRQQETLPMYTEKDSNSSSKFTNKTSDYSIHEKESLMSKSSTTELSVPEIRITFPDEVDESGKRSNGKVVVVKLGEHCVGLEPLDEQLPAYHREGDGHFQSLDLDRIGGLKEKDLQ